MPRIIKIGGNPWPYYPPKCDTCHLLERSLPDSDGETLVACDSHREQDGDTLCIKDGTVVYKRRI